MPHTALQTAFATLAAGYTTDNNIIQKMWQTIAHHYTETGRHYHILPHLADIIAQLQPVADSKDMDVLLFATFYHDIIYSVLKSDNEEQSAALAQTEMRQLGVPDALIAHVVDCIMATKSHEPTGDPVADLFTDADMSILGRDRDTYILYTQNVRREYNIYPDLLYKPGRKKVLAAFLAMERIYKTPHFYTLYEAQARANMEWEVNGSMA